MRKDHLNRHIDSYTHLHLVLGCCYLISCVQQEQEGGKPEETRSSSRDGLSSSQGIETISVLSYVYIIVGIFAHTSDGSGHSRRLHSDQDRTLRMHNRYSACPGADRRKGRLRMTTEEDQKARQSRRLYQTRENIAKREYMSSWGAHNNIREEQGRAWNRGTPAQQVSNWRGCISRRTRTSTISR